MSLEGKVAVITGAGRGIGEAIAERLVADGARVAAFDKAKAWAGSLVRSEEAGLVRFYQVDVTDRGSLETSFAQAQADLGPLDILVNNAGISMPAPLEDLPEEKWDAVTAVNIKAVFSCSQIAIRSMKERGGAIVTISSMSGVEPYPGMGAYSASKAAAVMLTRQMALEWAPYGVRVNAVCPGLVWSPLTDNLYRDADILAARTALVPLKTDRHATGRGRRRRFSRLRRRLLHHRSRHLGGRRAARWHPGPHPGQVVQHPAAEVGVQPPILTRRP